MPSSEVTARNRADAVIRAIVAHHADRPDRQQHGERLPDRIVETGVADLFEIDGIGLAQNIAFFLGYFARNADGEAGTRERMPADEVFGQPKLAAKLRTSSLNSSRRGSMSCSSCLRQSAHIVVLLIVTDGPPVKQTLSITSG